MAVGLLQEFEGTADQYNAVADKVDLKGNPPEGLISHCGSVIDGGKIRVMEIWESQGQFDAFMESRLGAAIGEVMGPDTAPTLFESNEAINVVVP